MVEGSCPPHTTCLDKMNYWMDGYSTQYRAHWINNKITLRMVLRLHETSDEGLYEDAIY